LIEVETEERASMICSLAAQYNAKMMVVNTMHSPELVMQHRRGRSGLTLSKLLIVIAIVGTLVGLMLPSTDRNSRGQVRTLMCRDNLAQITTALLDYQATHGSFPPAYTIDASGNRLHSWRTLILPHMEQEALKELHELIDLTKPWDHTVNTRARETLVDSYYCPSTRNDNGMTTYLAVLGQDCVFFGSRGRETTEFTDDTKNTIAIVDAPTKHAVHWMSPEDTTADEILGWLSDAEWQHPGIIQVTSLNGRVNVFSLDIEPGALREMLSMAGGEEE